jgi:hypothetical protein
VCRGDGSDNVPGNGCNLDAWQIPSKHRHLFMYPIRKWRSSSTMTGLKSKTADRNLGNIASVASPLGLPTLLGE